MAGSGQLHVNGSDVCLLWSEDVKSPGVDFSPSLLLLK